MIPPAVWAQTDVAPGIRYRELRKELGPGQPVAVQVIEVDTANPAVNVLPVRARDSAKGRETVPELARRYGAAAAINGGYFSFAPVDGASLGNLVMDGRLVASGPARSGLVWCPEASGREKLAVAMVSFQGTVQAGAERRELSGVNRGLGANEMVLYTAEYGVPGLPQGTATATAGAAGLVAASGAAAEWLRRATPVGGEVEVRVAAVQDACEAKDILSAGPAMVRGGRPYLEEKNYAHFAVRHPRSAAGVTNDGKLLLATVDGRQKHSVGMTIPELADLLVELGAEQAVNLDGGGSTTLYAAGTVKNSPSDGRLRPVSDAILVFSVNDKAAMIQLVDVLSANPSELGPKTAAALRAGLAKASPNWRALANAVSTAHDMNPVTRRILSEAIAAQR